MNAPLILLRALAGALVLTSAVSCSIKMQHGALKAPATVRSGVVTTAAKATGAETRAGWATLTVFAIPIVPIYVEGDANGAVMNQVHDALRKAGYTPRTGAVGTGKVLVCRVERLKYRNYTWFFPIVPTWGSATLRVELLSNGAPVWAKTFTGSGSTLNFANGYTASNRRAMTKVGNQMVDAFASDEFHAALNR